MDGSIQETFIEFITNAIQYSNETGRILDIMGGRDNIVISGGELFIIDPYDPYCFQAESRNFTYRRTLERSRHILLYYLNGLPENRLNGQANEVLLNTLNYVRFINAMAAYFEIEERVDFQLPEKNFSKLKENITQLRD